VNETEGLSWVIRKNYQYLAHLLYMSINLSCLIYLLYIKASDSYDIKKQTFAYIITGFLPGIEINKQVSSLY